MDNQATLYLRLYSVAINGLKVANKGNPSLSKSDAFKFINQFN